MNNYSKEQLSGKIKLDITTNLEYFLNGLLLIAVGSIIPVIFYFFTDDAWAYTDIFVLPLIIIFLFWIIINVDQYYVMDLDEKCLMYNNKIFMFERYTKYADFSDIDAVTTTAYGEGGREATLTTPGAVLFTYQTIIVLNSGYVIPIRECEQDFVKVDDFTKMFAETAQVFYKPSRETLSAKAVKHNGKYVFVLSKEIQSSRLGSWIAIGGLILLFVIFGLTIFRF